MGALDFILGLFGVGRVDFGRVNPDDVESYWRVEHDVDKAEREGEAPLAAALARWGLKSLEHWDKVKTALVEKHTPNPEFKMAAARLSFEAAVQQFGGGYRIPEQYLTPPHGITLDRYAAINVRLQRGEPAAQVYGYYQLDAARWGEVERTWAGRMGPQADSLAANILSGQYQVMVQYANAAFGGRS